MALDPVYQILSKLYSQNTLASMPAPGAFYNNSGTVFGRSPMQIQGGSARHAPVPQQQQQSGAGGLSGALLAGGSLFQQGGPLYEYAGGSSAGSLWGNLMGGSNYFNTNTQSGLDSYLAATQGL